jgi:hypothetical protein
MANTTHTLANGANGTYLIDGNPIQRGHCWYKVGPNNTFMITTSRDYETAPVFGIGYISYADWINGDTAAPFASIAAIITWLMNNAYDVSAGGTVPAINLLEHDYAIGADSNTLVDLANLGGKTKIVLIAINNGFYQFNAANGFTFTSLTGTIDATNFGGFKQNDNVSIIYY